LVTAGNLDNIRDPRGKHQVIDTAAYDTGMIAPAALVADDFSNEPALLAEALRDRGLCWIAGWPGPELRQGLHDDLRRLQSSAALLPASIGRRDGRAQRGDIRADATCWLDDPSCGKPAREFLARMDEIRAMLNRQLYLGLTEIEAHYAAYPPGGGYARHRDRFRDSDARVVSWVTYLNEDWSVENGGALRLYLEDGCVEFAPIGGSVCFLSELEHEVMPTARERLSIACWFRRRSDHPL
jgi:SM-20-related protein